MAENWASRNDGHPQIQRRQEATESKGNYIGGPTVSGPALGSRVVKTHIK